MKKFSLVVLTLAMSLFFSCVHTGHMHHHDETDEAMEGRLLISDAEGKAHVYSVEERKIIKTFDLGFNASAVYPTAKSNFGVILSRKDNKALFVDSGFELENHGDHAHLHVHEPAMMSQMFNYGKPTHYQITDFATTIFFDGKGAKGNPIDSFEEPAYVAVIRESELEANEMPKTVMLKNNMHGSAEPVGKFLLAPARVYQKGSPLADRVQLFKLNGDKYEFVKMYKTDATELHGSVTHSVYTLFAAGDGLLMFTQSADGFREAYIPYPKEMQEVGNGEEKVRVGAFARHKQCPIIVGGASHHLFAINPDEKTIKEIEWGKHRESEVVKYTFDAHGKNLIFLDKAGYVHIADVASNFKNVKHIHLFKKGLEIKGHGGPRLVCNGNTNELYVINPIRKSISVIDIEKGKVIDEIKGKFTPTDVAWLGIENMASLTIIPEHDDDDDEDHNHNEHEHNH